MNEKAVLLHAANDGYTAEFVLHNAHVTLESRSAALTDSESLSALAEELMAALEKQ